jgi:Zn-finger nucleic acid-binding protein
MPDYQKYNCICPGCDKRYTRGSIVNDSIEIERCDKCSVVHLSYKTRRPIVGHRVSAKDQREKEQAIARREYHL